jgi:hypothetical protein
MRLAYYLLAASVLAGAPCFAPPAAAQTSTAAAQRYLETPPGEKPRVVITTDPELDDLNTLIRYLLYSADVRTEGLIYASSQFHWKGDGQGTVWFVPGREYDRFGLKICPCTSWRWAEGERFIDDAIEAYAEAYPNLRIHDPDYPSPSLLKSKVRWGNVAFDGEMSEDTAGSDLIKSLLLDDENSPVYLHAWGGQSTIARALKSIEEQFRDAPNWAQVRARVIAKAVIHASGDQDDTYVKYIKPNWPEIRYREPRGGVSLAYNAQSSVSEEDAVYFSPEWTRRHISSKGPLGSLYRVWGDGKQMVEGDIFDFFGFTGKSAAELRAEGYMVWTPIHAPGAFISEGDTPTFLNLVDNGLRGYRDEIYGGWGGLVHTTSLNYGQLSVSLEQDAPAERTAAQRQPTDPFLAPTQRDFAARFAWATTPDYKDANHHPWIVLGGPRLVSARPGQSVPLQAVASDRDGDEVTLRWWRWDEADSYAGPVPLARATGRDTSVSVPRDAKAGDTIHIIAEATDNGSPALTRYERIVLRVAD